MIKLEVPLYCHECPEFNPVTDQIFTHASSINGELLRKTITVVKCKYEDRCKTIYEYMNTMREKNKLYNEVKNQGGELI